MWILLAIVISRKNYKGTSKARAITYQLDWEPLSHDMIYLHNEVD